MIVRITGFINNSYTKKDTGELVECLELHYVKKSKDKNAVGEVTGSEFVTAKAFPEQFAAIVKAGEGIIGKNASISKDTKTFNGKTYSVLDELELLNK